MAPSAISVRKAVDTAILNRREFGEHATVNAQQYNSAIRSRTARASVTSDNLIHKADAPLLCANSASGVKLGGCQQAFGRPEFRAGCTMR